jgi:acetylornithine deacetylase
MPTTFAVDDAVDRLRGDLVALLQALVRTPSISGHEQAAQRVIAERYQRLGLGVEQVEATRDLLVGHPAFSDDGIPFVDRFSVVGRWTGRGGGRSLILNGHIDVVPPGDPARWSRDAWSAEVHDGLLYGRGACDMKAGLCASAIAVEALQSIGFEPDGDVVLQSVISEETGGIGTLSTIVHGCRADACIITEPTGLLIWTAQSGALTFRITVDGRAAHAAMKSSGVSAVEEFMPILAMLKRLDIQRHQHFQHPLFANPMNVAPISIGVVRAGDWPSTVPESLVAEGRFGIFPGESLAEARATFEHAVAQEASCHPWLGEHPPQLEWFEGQFESAEVPTDTEIAQVMGRAHAAVNASTVAFGGVPAGTDARLFIRHANIPTILYGPGDVAAAHTADESVSIDEVVRCAKALAHAIIEWCGGSIGVPSTSTRRAHGAVRA